MVLNKEISEVSKVKIVESFMGDPTEIQCGGKP